MDDRSAEPIASGRRSPPRRGCGPWAAAGRIAAETISPHPPGVPVVASGEVITDEALDHLRSGAEYGVLIPVAADSSVRTLRVVARGAHTRG
ncbi:hypothetical protein [Streptomyces sp. NRRL S-146]|uniref:Orn/Lys/Arg family decarboxylase n=1 Tax=Streptomyces sp. NRRL S-146 TaxID=1463884 RepID=UPI00227906D2|nr:hypothetical protein [Streptomyces sp. NRRL S-146]